MTEFKIIIKEEEREDAQPVSSRATGVAHSTIRKEGWREQTGTHVQREALLDQSPKIHGQFNREQYSSEAKRTNSQMF